MAHVLIVDDDEDIRFTVRAMLEDLGEHTVSEAPDGPSALALLRAATEQYVVLLDLLMPNMDGIEVLRGVARDQRRAGQLTPRYRHPLARICGPVTALSSRQSGRRRTSRPQAIRRGFNRLPSPINRPPTVSLSRPPQRAFQAGDVVDSHISQPSFVYVIIQ
jgi:CheY-like chemotaxis protein